MGRTAARAAPQEAPDALARVVEHALEPRVEGLVEEALGLFLGADLEERVDAGFDGALAQEIAAKRVDGADARDLEVRERCVEPGPF